MQYKTRLDIERSALARFFPEFRIQDPFGEKAGVIGRMRPNNGREYVVWLELGAFPHDAPRLYLISPKNLRSYAGQLLSGVGSSAAMHLLDPDIHGYPQICHYNDDFWHPDISLYKILMKARFWIEAYEQHLRHGKPIDAYLSHM